MSLKGSFYEDILGSIECVCTDQWGVGKGVSFKYHHDLNSQWRIKICKMQAAMKAMIKCVHLNMCQLYTYMWTPGKVADVLHELMGNEIIEKAAS